MKTLWKSPENNRGNVEKKKRKISTVFSEKDNRFRQKSGIIYIILQLFLLHGKNGTKVLQQSRICVAAEAVLK